MKYTDRLGRAQTLSWVQALYLAEATRHRLECGWGGLRATRTVRLLEERGLIELQRGSAPSPAWTITGLTRLGAEVLQRWRQRPGAVR